MKVKVRREGSETVVSFSGDLNEHSEPVLSKLASELAGPVVFDWGGVETINSLGASYWIQLLDALANVPTYRFVNATVGFIGYANAVEPFVGKGAVSSLVVPMYCSKCDDSTQVVIEAFKLSTGEPPAARCKDCKGPTEPEIELSAYLSFLKR